MSLIKKGIIASENLAIGKIKLMKKQEVKISSEKFLMMKLNFMLINLIKL